MKKYRTIVADPPWGDEALEHVTLESLTTQTKP
jgi:hypothetical protein